MDENDPRRFPPDAPVVPNDAWRWDPPPAKCRRRFGFLWHLHHVPMPETTGQGGGALVCLRCGERFYIVGHTGDRNRWRRTR